VGLQVWEWEWDAPQPMARGVRRGVCSAGERMAGLMSTVGEQITLKKNKRGEKGKKKRKGSVVILLVLSIFNVKEKLFCQMFF
jgi:hypothetical protein